MQKVVFIDKALFAFFKPHKFAPHSSRIDLKGFELHIEFTASYANKFSI